MRGVFDTVPRDGLGVYSLQGHLTIHLLGELKDWIEKTLEREGNLRVSLDHVTFLDTAVLQYFVVLGSRLPSEGAFCVVSCSPEVDRILALCGLRTALPRA